MSIDAVSFGQRLREVRLTRDYSQAKVAARLEIADRTYKFYELGKREMPISTALKFCSEFGVELKWLATGSGPKLLLEKGSLVEEAVLAVLLTHQEKGLSVPAEKIAKQVNYVMEQSSSKGTAPVDEARLLVDII